MKSETEYNSDFTKEIFYFPVVFPMKSENSPNIL